jgi:hypothetical protein
MPVGAAVGGPVRAASLTQTLLSWTAPALRWAARRRPAPHRLGNALEQPLRLAAPHRPPRGLQREAPALLRSARAPPSSLPRTPSQGLCGSLPLLHGGGCAAPSTGPLRSFLPPCKRLYCKAAGLLRQDLASLRAPAGPLPRSDRQRGRESVADGPRCWWISVVGPVRAGRGAGVGWRPAWWQRAPTPLAGRCAPWLYERSFTAGLCAAGHRGRGRAPLP